MHNNLHKLGSILKAARLGKNLTREQLSEKIGISHRYLMAIENENKKPSYDVLFRLIRELGVSADTIFYPENESSNTDKEQLVRLLQLCDIRDIMAITAMVKVLLENEKV